MINNDVISYLQPMPNNYNKNEWRDVTGKIEYIDIHPHSFCIRGVFEPGLYHCYLETENGAFDMKTADVPMVRVPDGALIPVGPWDLNHIKLEMAMPMAKTYVNGRLIGGMWFDMPGPEEIAENRLTADFGFEAEAGETELKLELVEHDRARLDWRNVKFMTISHDSRLIRPIEPASDIRPRVYLGAHEVQTYRERLAGSPELMKTMRWLKDEALGDDPGTMSTLGQLARSYGWDIDLACLVYLVTGDVETGALLKNRIVKLCSRPSWSRMKDPLIMGGDNDRGVGVNLYTTGIAWDWCNGLFDAGERTIILEKVSEYLQKMYDFTVLQRAYMGYRTADPHSLGTWNGAAIACMAFYDDLPIARKALPFFHGLFHDSLSVFPDCGKTVWATFFSYHLIRYLAAAHTFGGFQNEWLESPYLKNLGNALLGCFKAPNAQESQRGLRTIEHRYLTAYLNRFHPDGEIASIYGAFFDSELKTAGDVHYGIFDYLYAPAPGRPAAEFPKMPYFAKDIGEIVFNARGPHGISGCFTAGHKEGRGATLRLMPHNRESDFYRGITLRVGGNPVLIDLNFSYGIDGRLANNMCIEDGGLYVHGQYLCGNVPSQNSSYIRRCLISDRFIYAHAVMTGLFHPKHHVKSAERIMIVDLESGSMVFSDAFEGEKPVGYATHLHCSGSVTDVGDCSYRLTGGQANLIAGFKFGGYGLGDEEKGEIFVKVLDGLTDKSVTVEEPEWQPTYIYNLNGGVDSQDIKLGKFPRFRRWRLGYDSKATRGSFLFALSGGLNGVNVLDGRIVFDEGAYAVFGNGGVISAYGYDISAEAVIADERNKKLMMLGASAIHKGKNRIAFLTPVDMAVEISGNDLQGTIYATTSAPVAQAEGFTVDGMSYDPYNASSHCNWVGNIRGI